MQTVICEYLTDPLGIDVAQPRLRWQVVASDPALLAVSDDVYVDLSHITGRTLGSDRQAELVQKAYQVLVNRNPDSLAHDEGDLWDSVVVSSDQTHQVVYQGEKLASHSACYWKVRVCDAADRWSGWSEPARWTMGLLSAEDWTARWIGSGAIHDAEPGKAKENTLADPWFRTSFELQHPPQRAVIHLASVAYHELYINGRRVGDAVLMPSVFE